MCHFFPERFHNYLTFSKVKGKISHCYKIPESTFLIGIAIVSLNIVFSFQFPNDILKDVLLVNETPLIIHF
jgi:hypothetical protein